MSTVDKLLAKAMSTSSDEEALVAFRMARKKNGGATLKSQANATRNEPDYRRQAKEAYEKYIEIKDHNQRLYKSYTDELRKKQELEDTILELKSDVRLGLKFWRVSFVIMSAVFSVFLGFTAFF